MSDLGDLDYRINRASKRLARTIFVASAVVIDGLLIVCGSAVAAAMQYFVSPRPLAPGAMVGIVAATLAAMGGLAKLFIQRDASRELELAREAIREASDLVHLMDDIDLYKSEQRRTLELHQAMRQMRATIEKKIASGISIETLLDFMFQAAESSLTAAFDFRAKDYWTVCIYVAEEDPGDHRRYLRCIAHRRAITCEIAKARRWQEGVGVVGAAYAYRQEVIIPDISAPELGSAFRLAPDISTMDDVRHRSFIAAPIQLDGEKEPWGAVIATSDRPSHFSLKLGEGLQPAETLRSLVGMVSLAVRVTKLCSSSP